MYNRISWPSVLSALFLVTLPTIFYFPVLFNGMTQIHGETLTVGIPLMDMLWNAIHGESSALWTEHIYGGHPIFAEGQGAFAHPLNLLAASLFSPLLAYNVFHWLCLIFSGAGTYLMCRSFGCSRPASHFGAVALIFSGVWLLGRSIYPVSGTIVWVPWALWAMNNWLANANLKSAALFGLVMCLMLLAGYPQIVHGTVVYLALYLLVCLCFSSKRELWLKSAKIRFSTGIFAVVMCCGLAAVQLIPLFELVGESHRSDGVDLLALGKIPLEYFVRGFLFTIEPAVDYVEGQTASNAYFPVFGSLLFCMLASLVVFARKGIEQLAHMVAVAVLLLLALGTATPVFALIYNGHLLPGLSNFRIMWPYLFVATTGIALLTAMALDDIGKKIGTESNQVAKGERTRQGIFLAVWLLVWLGIMFAMHTAEVRVQHYISVTLLGIGLAVIVYFRKGNLLPVIALWLICLDMFLLRMDSFAFSSRGLVEKPQVVQKLEDKNLFQDYKVLHNSNAGALIYRPTNHPQFEEGIKRLLASLLPASNALWGISNLDGTTALPARRFSLAWPVIGREVQGEHAAEPGLRLIDFLSLRFIIEPRIAEGTGFYKRIVDWKIPVHYVENPYARPKFQVFHQAVSVEDVEQALDVLAVMQDSALVLEADGIEDFIEQAAMGTGKDFEFEVEKRSAGSYEFQISAEAAAWFFIADANYPGWNAYLDEERVDVFYAQVLGKAIFVPPGEHHLRVEFEPVSFRIGLFITLISLAVLALLFLGGAVDFIRERGAVKRTT